MSLPEGFKIVSQPPQAQIPDGFKVVEPQSEPMNKDSAFSSGLDVIKKAWTGTDEFKDAGNIQDYINTLPRFGLNSEGMGLAASSMFGSDEDLIKTFQKHQPDVPIRQDSTGNPFVEKDGKKFYFNKTGADIGDALDVVGEAGTYLAGGMLTAPIKSMPLRAATTAVTEGSINAGNQLLAGRDEVNKGEVATAAALGGAVEVASPFVGKLYNWAKGKLTGSEKAIEIGRQIAADAGIDQVDDATTEVLGKMRLGVDDSVTDAALIAEAKHGIKLTRGQATQNIDQMSAEEGLRNTTGSMNRFKAVDSANEQAIDANLKGIRSGLSDQFDDTLQPAVSAETALDGLKNAESAAKESYKEAFNKVGDLSISKDSVDNLTDRVATSLKENNVRISKRGTGEAMEALEIIGEAQDLATKQGSFNLGDYKEHRGYIDNLYSGQMNANDKRALTVVKNEYDNWFYSSVDEGLMSGSPEALEQLKDARGLMTDYMNRFKSKDASKKVIKDIIEKDVTPETFSNLIAGVNGYGKSEAANAVKAFKEAVGADSEAFKALQVNVFEKMIMGGKEGVKGAEGLVNTFYNAYQKKGSSMMKELFDNKTSNEIKSLMSSVKQLIKPTEVANASGSGRLGAQIVSQFGRSVPILSDLYAGLKTAGGFSKAMSKPAKSTSKGIRHTGLAAIPLLNEGDQ